VPNFVSLPDGGLPSRSASTGGGSLVVDENQLHSMAGRTARVRDGKRRQMSAFDDASTTCLAQCAVSPRIEEGRAN